MLLKSNSHAAREAVLRIEPEALEMKAAAPRQESPEAIEIARLRLQVSELETSLQALRDDWSAELAQAEARAKEAAASEHVRSDAARLDEVKVALIDAQASFARQMQETCLPIARTLATKAFTRLVGIRQEEEDWLARLIERRISELNSGSALSLQVSRADFSGNDCDELQAILPAGTSVACDARIAPGTARIVLALGAIDIDGRSGSQQLAALLDADGAHG